MNTTVLASIITAVVGPLLTLIVSGMIQRNKRMKGMEEKLERIMDQLEQMNSKINRLNEGIDTLAQTSVVVFESLHSRGYINGETEQARENLRNWLVKNGSLSLNN